MEYELGSGYTARTVTERGVEGSTGLIVEGPAGQHCPHSEGGRCAGALSFECSPDARRRGRPLWKVVSLEPLTLTPSIRCACDVKHPGQGQHGIVTGGRWENAGGIVS